MPGCASAQGQLQETPSALRLVPDPACSLGDIILASPSLQVQLPLTLLKTLPLIGFVGKAYDHVFAIA